MITQTVTVTEKNAPNIIIGRRGTYNTEEIVFDLTYLVETFGSGSAVMMVKRPMDNTAYPAVTEQDGSALTWTVSDTDTNFKGHGECELFWYVDDGLAKSLIWPLTILRDIGTTTEEPPEPYQTWVDDLTALGAETLQNAQSAAQSATSAGNAKTAAEIAQGKAEDAQEAAEAAQELLENASATATTLPPSSSATASYSDGVFTFGIPKGDKGDPGDPATNLVTSVNGETGAVVLDATDVGAYVKPSGGIPKTDLASAVQTSLGKADTALQTAPVTSVNSKTGDVVLDAGDIAYESTTVESELTTINSALSSLSAVTEIIDTASGAIASFPDGSGLPMRSLLAQIEPQQDLHGYDNPWPAGGGKNLLDLDFTNDSGTVAGMTFTHGESYITLKGTASGTSYATFNLRTPITADLNTDYTYSLTISGTCPGGLYGIEFNNGTTLVQRFRCNTTDATSKTLQISSAFDNVTFKIEGLTSGLVFDCEIKIQFEKGSSKTTWQTYSNLCPISGWTGLSGERDGKNLFDTSTAGNEWVTSGGYITTKDSAKSVRLDCKAGEVFTLSNKNTASATNILVIACFDANNTMLSREVVSSTTKSVTATVPNRASFLIACFNDWSLVDEAQLEVGSTATEYEAPVTSLPITCTWKTEAGTVYDGYIDVVSGVLTVTHRYVLLDGTQTINKHSTTAYNGFHLNLANNGLPACASTEDGTVGQFSYYKLGKLINANGNAFVGANTIQFRNDSLTTKDEAIAYLTANPLQVVYPLAQPQTYQLTPQQISTLLGNNTVFVDTGSVSVTYQASIKGYIDKVLGQ